MSHYEGKVCVVTGGASGIGRALCARLAGQGAVVTVADVQGDEAETWAATLRERGGRADAARVDVRDSAQVEALVSAVSERHGRLDLVFNIAGVVVVAEALQQSLDDWRRVFDVNLWGVVHGCQAAFPRMAAQGHGHIVNMASVAGLVPTPIIAPYVASKHAVLGMSEALRAEGADLGVKVSVICPGIVRTPMLEDGAAAAPGMAATLAQLAVRAVSSDEAATAILRGVQRNRAIILFPFSARIFVGLYRYFPGLTRWLLRVAARRARALEVGANKPSPEN